MFSKYVIKTVPLLLFVFGCFAGTLYSQTCGMSIEATSDDSETAVKGVSATAISQETSHIYKSTFKQGLPYFESLPQGEYRVTVKKVGFKQTIDIISHTCSDAENGIDTAYISLWKGRSDESVDLVANPVKEMRLEKITKVGSVDPPDEKIDATKNDNISALPEQRPVPKTISGGILNGKAISLPAPVYPAAARAVKAGGSVSVQVLIDEEGNIVSASAVSGHPLLQSAAVSAARGARFSPTLLSGQPVKISGILVYNFVP